MYLMLERNVTIQSYRVYVIQWQLKNFLKNSCNHKRERERENTFFLEANFMIFSSVHLFIAAQFLNIYLIFFQPYSKYILLLLLLCGQWRGEVGMGTQVTIYKAKTLYKKFSTQAKFHIKYFNIRYETYCRREKRIL